MNNLLKLIGKDYLICSPTPIYNHSYYLCDQSRIPQRRRVENMIFIEEKIQDFVLLQITDKFAGMATLTLNTIEYLILIVSEFAQENQISEVEAYRYLNMYGAMQLCEKHYDIMHTLSVEENVDSLKDYCRRKGGSL